MSTPMKMNDYQDAALATAFYPKPVRTPLYPAIGLAGECGELGNVIATRDRVGSGAKLHDRLVAEAGDCLWYLANLAHDFEVRFSSWLSPDDSTLDDTFAAFSYGQGSVSRPEDAFIYFSASVGSLCENVKKTLRDDADLITELRRSSVRPLIRQALSDLATVLAAFGLTLDEAAQKNLAKLADRKKRDVLKGSGDDR